MSKRQTVRRMPKRFLVGAPREALDIFDYKEKATPLRFDVIFADTYGHGDPRGPYVCGVGYGEHGERGCSFELSVWEAQSFRRRNSRKRTHWAKLPEPTKEAITYEIERAAEVFPVRA